VATCNEIINRALRKLGALGTGQTPTADETAAALDGLKALYRRWINQGAFGRLRDVTPSGPYTAGENERIFVNSPSVTSITFPEQVPSFPLSLNCDYGLAEDFPVTVEATTGPFSTMRFPLDGAVITITDATSATDTSPQTQDWIYDGSIKAWVAIDSLDTTKTAPLSFRDPGGLAACLAFEISDEWGLTAQPATIRAALAFQTALVTRFSNSTERVTRVSYF
jgi:hypothetical protein